MKKIILSLLLLIAFSIHAQVVNPVKWTTKVEQLSETEFNLVVSGIIEPEWHVYSQFTPDGGPLPMVLEFKNSKGNYELIGKPKESKYKKQFNDVFEVDEYLFEKSVTVTQKVKIINSNTSKINLHLEYQACKEQCINDNKDFVFALPALAATAIQETKTMDTVTDVASQTVEKTNLETKSQPKVDAKQPVKDTKKGLWSIFFLAFLGGFAALLTPCVFPMIPMTVSFFTKQSKNKAAGIRNAIIYGVSIILIYVLLGILVTWIFGADALNALSTNVWFNIIFFILEQCCRLNE